MRLARTLAVLLLLPLMAAAGEKSKRDAAKGVDALFRDFAGDAPGASVLVLRESKVVLKKSYGFANLEARRRATSKTNYRLASVTKQFTAMAILLLAERGQLTLDDPLPKFFPDFPAYGREIRVRHLLNHTSGMPAYEDFLPAGTNEPVLDADVLEILKQRDQAYFPPGAQFRYSNSGYALLALIVEKVSGSSFPEFLKRHVFAPLKMRDTCLNLRRVPPREARRAYGYTKREKSWERTDQSRTSYVLGDGGIYSSAEDLAKWARALDFTPLISHAALEQATSATVRARPLGEDRPATAQTDERLGYGYGWFVSLYRGHNAVWHGGSSIGFRNHILRIPDQHLTVIILTNRNDADPAALARNIADLYLPS